MSVDEIVSLINESLSADEKAEVIGKIHLDRSKKPTVDEVVTLVNESLSVEEKAEVIGKILGKASGLSVIWGSQNFNVGTNIHINLMSHETSADLLDAIAQLIRDGGSTESPKETEDN